MFHHYLGLQFQLISKPLSSQAIHFQTVKTLHTDKVSRRDSQERLSVVFEVVYCVCRCKHKDH